MRKMFCLSSTVALALVMGCAHPKSETKTAATTNSNGNVSQQQPAPAPQAPPAEDKNDCGLVRVHFDLNAAQIKDADKPLLERAAVCLKQDKKLHVKIEGNADERGTEEYNLALGDQRARAVATYLERLGASQTQLKTVSYGKEQPECTEHDEECWSRNRRAAVKPVSQ